VKPIQVFGQSWRGGGIGDQGEALRVVTDDLQLGGDMTLGVE
jgi:hypothetical protein